MEATPHFETLEIAVRRLIIDALTQAHGNQRRAAALLGVSRWRLARMVRRLELDDVLTSMRREAPRSDPGTASYDAGSGHTGSVDTSSRSPGVR